MSQVTQSVREGEMNRGVISAVGNTPLVRLNRVIGDIEFRLFAKLEGMNPGGSVKDRAAFFLIEKALERREINKGTTVIESSSGNMGIGLAIACGFFSLRFICVVDPKTTKQNLDILRAYGAEIEMVSDPDPESGEYLPNRIRRVKSLLGVVPNSYWPNQYANTDNASAHHLTMQEITEALQGRVDYLFCATSTCGTLRGCAEFARQHRLETKIIAVDAIGSAIYGGESRKRLIPGHGAAIRPELHKPELVDRFIKVSDLDCVVGCRRLLKSESILAGGSSGGLIRSVEYIQNDIPQDSNCVLILPDRGERYLDTIYSDSWVSSAFGEVSHLWQGLS
jgi:cysteine synthase A